MPITKQQALETIADKAVFALFTRNEQIQIIKASK